MKNMKKLSYGLAFLLVGILVGCGVSTVAEQNYPLKIWFQNENGEMSTYNIVDDNTGVHYVVVKTRSTGGYMGVSVCPRYNEDGSLYTER